jgi:VanZ family protein
VKSFLRIWWPSLAFAVFIFALSSVERPPFLADLDFSDKWKHFLLYAVFTVLVYRSALAWLGAAPGVVWLTVLLVSGYGVTDEFHQWFVPGRSCDWRDWLADTAAAVTVSLLLARRRAVSAADQ